MKDGRADHQSSESSIEKRRTHMTVEFEDHCWKDVVTPEILKTYTPYHRETYIGQRPALLAIDLYNLAYEGGAKEPHELVDTYKSSCGIYAHNAIKPTQELFALARSLKIPVFYTTSETGRGPCDQSPACEDRSPSIRDQGRVQARNGRRGHL